MKKRKTKDFLVKSLFFLASFISASMIVIIFIFILGKGLSVFLPSYPERISFFEFLRGLSWRPDQKEYGVLFILINTLRTSFTAALIAFPISVLSALFIVKIAPKKLSSMLSLIVEILAAIPSIVYGVFASGVIVKLVDALSKKLNYSSFGGRSSLSVSLLLALMIIPTITSLSIVAIRSVDKDLEFASMALGASKMETNFKLVLPAAKSGIIAGLVLALARAFGEATAVSMVAGNKMMGPTVHPFDITRTLTSTMLAGLSETSGLDYDIRYSVGVVLMVSILVTNFIIHLFERRLSGDSNE